MPYRRAARKDRNHNEIVEALKSIGATVQDLSPVGGGCPDILVGYRNNNYLLEIKDGEKAPSDRKLTKPQVEWHQLWQGAACVVKTVDEAIAAVGGMTWTN